ncbi:MAG TPA: PilZ domain-containing protein [Candidatus Saccharimonadia bacterium]|nr:PilZ domain-containing protein [Candidatus Saccharimonadia bacterium]
MREIFDDRRQEPRFSTSGTARFALDGRQHEAVVLDLSLNGLKVTRPEGWSPAKGERHRVEIEIPGANCFTAEVALVYLDEAELGLEFHDMPPRDFAVLARLIDHYARLKHKQAGMSPA